MMRSAFRTLIADDQPDVLEALRLLLKSEGHHIEAVNSPHAVIDCLRKQQYDLLLMDLNYRRDTTSGEEGLDLLDRVQRLDSRLPVIVMTAWGSIPLAVEAMRRGARDFVLKPWENGQLLAVLRAQTSGRSHTELDEAVTTQRGLLPKRIPQMPGYDITATWRPAGAVSGDYLDVLELGPRTLAICVADAIGKGVPAALLMSNLQAAIHALAGEDTRPEQLCARVNRVVAGNLNAGKYITFFYGLVDEARGKLTYTNAGHAAPVLVRACGDVVRLERGGIVLGIMPEWCYEQGEVSLFPGDRLALFTDGISEAVNAAGEEFGEERLVEVMRSCRHLPAAEIQRAVMATVAEFTGGEFQDDATLVVVAVT